MATDVIKELPNLGIKPYYADKWRAVYYGDCREIAQSLSGAASAIVTDPPYELSFMGKSWDSNGVSFQPVTWSIIQKACKPGAMMLAFGGTRTFHRIAVAIEDAGWEIRDTVMWVYGQGFPKSMDIAKTIDKQLKGHPQGSTKGDPESPNSGKFKTQRTEGKRSEADKGQHFGAGPGQFMWKQGSKYERDLLLDAQLWSGWGTALKPAWEPIILSMNPVDGTFAGNALRHGVAGLNIDECRIPFQNDADKRQAAVPQPNFNSATGAIYNFKTGEGRNGNVYDPSRGRFPANLIHDGNDEVVALFPQSNGQQGNVKGTEPSHTGDKNTNCYGEYGRVPAVKRGDNGSAARFFYCAKASRSERGSGDVGNNHPTVKPLALMTYLCTLVKMPQHNLILDPFCGSGSTLLACAAIGAYSIGIDSDEASCEIAAARCAVDTIKRIKEGIY
jgi:site-specific DNA-methyltransferase (adenine-specific)